ncbi:hypothetical protein GCM10023311_21180 [Flaviramulus aquimarinus]|uniref:Uncharacterized protein n=1 Tax=Flaviramulus aquimarinus TaxID=1170456 RepID=A0ABP9FBB8_9FLAO
MKTILTLPYILAICFFYTISYGQQNSQNQKDIFKLEVIKYSREVNPKKPHYHLLSLQNNSNKELTFNLSTTVDDTNDKSKKNNPNLIVEIWSENLSKTFNSITLVPKESIRFKVKTTHNTNARLGSMNLCKVIAQLPNSNNKKTVSINAYIPNSNELGH